MKRLFLALALVGLAACEGSRGPEGAPGTSGRVARTPSYCAGGGAQVNDGNNWTLDVYCLNVADIPLSGQCLDLEPSALTSTSFLSENSAIHWDDTTQIAGWHCRWGWQGPSTPFTAQAEICCATPQ